LIPEKDGIPSRPAIARWDELRISSKEWSPLIHEGEYRVRGFNLADCFMGSRSSEER